MNQFISSAEKANLEQQDLNKPKLTIKKIFTKQWAQYAVGLKPAATCPFSSFLGYVTPMCFAT